MSNIIVIYHGNCADGFSAAWVLHHHFSEVDDSVIFHPGIYGEDPPNVMGKNVFLVDFSYKRPVLDAMIEQCLSMVILDHHKSAAEDLDGIFEHRKVSGVFDMKRSGAMITWNWVFPDVQPPQLLKHVQDRDLWEFKLDGTREIQAALFSFPYDFEIWEEYMLGDLGVLSLLEDGKAIERKHFKDIDELLGVTQREMKIGGYRVPVANLPYTLVSDAAHKMAIGKPFAACYWDTPKGRVFGLRSVDGGTDVSKIAVQYGGGGHKHASGFTLPYDRISELELTKIAE